MSFGSPQEAAGAVAQRDASRQQQDLWKVAGPALQRVLTQSFGDLSIDQTGKMGIPKSVQEQFGKARAGMNRDFDIAERGADVYTTQSFKQSGSPYSEAQLSDTLLSQGRTLEEGRRRAMDQLKFEEGQAGLGQFNNLMNIMSGASGSALNLGAGFGQARNSAIRFLPNQSQEGGAISGGMAGASAGSAFGPYGALAGLFIGGALGYAGSG